ncbi:Formin-homology 2 domain-containing protein, partial [Globisporangium splendens]
MPSFISQLITTKAVPGEKGVGNQTPPTAHSNSHNHGAMNPNLPVGFGGPAGLYTPGLGGGAGIGGIGGMGFNSIGGSPATRLPMRSNMGLPMSLQMPLNFQNANASNQTTAGATMPMIPMIPNIKRSVSKEYATTAYESDSTSTSSSSSVSPSSSSSNNSRPWNDNEKMQDFFMHIKDPEQTVHAENKLINIRDLMAKNAEPANRHDEQSQVVAPPQDGGDVNNVLSEMLASRNGGAAEKSNQEEQGDGRSNLLAEMLARRGGGSHDDKPVQKKNDSNKSEGGDSGRNNMLAEMLARRGRAPESSPQKNEVKSGDSRGNILAEMLSRRGGGSKNGDGDSPKKGSKRKALADMLLKRGQASGSEDESPKKSSSNPLSAMLKRRLPQSDKGEAGASKEESAKDQTPLKDHPTYMQYFKMLKIGHPPQVVKHRMQRDGVDPSILDHDPNKPLPEPKPAPAASGGFEDAETEAEFQARLAEYNEKSSKYTQMLKVGLPRPVVEHKMRMEGVDTAWLDGPPTKKKRAVAAAPAAPTEEEIAAHKAKYEKYFAMLRVGLPRGAVEHKMRMAGIDPKELDGPRPVAAPAPAPTASPAAPNFKRANSIRKKIHWEVKRTSSIQSASRESLWNFTIADDAMSEIQISRESKEMLEKLFVKTISDTKKKPAAKKAAANDGDDKKKPMIVLIDMKKSQNIAITLARVKMPFPELKREIIGMNPTVLSTAQLQSLMDMWSDRKEQEAIDAFNGDFSLLGTAEQFLVETRNIPRFKEKLGALVFKQEFPSRVHELRKVSLHALHSEQKSLEEGLKSLKHEAQVVIPTAGDTDAELATSILQHFATEVEHELEALQDLLDQMNASKSHFLEYFEEEETGEELDILLGHISNFTAEYRREHKKYLEAQRQQKLKEQKELAQATRHSMSSPFKAPTSRQKRHSIHGESSRLGTTEVTKERETTGLRERQSHALRERQSHALRERDPPSNNSLRSLVRSSTSFEIDESAHESVPLSPISAAASPHSTLLNSTASHAAPIAPANSSNSSSLVAPSSSLAGIRNEDLQTYRVSPTALGGQNLVLEKEDEAFRELEILTRALKVGGEANARPLVVDVTLPTEGREEFMATRVQVAQKANAHVVVVTTCEFEKIAVTFPVGMPPVDQSERFAKVMETELMFGFTTGNSEGGSNAAAQVGAGALYQQIHATKHVLEEKDGILARGVALAQSRTHAPIYLSFSFDVMAVSEQQQCVLTWIHEILRHGAERDKIVICHMDRWCDDNDVNAAFLQSLLHLGVNLLFNMIGLSTVSDVALINPCITSSAASAIEPPRDRTIANCIALLIHQQGSNISQILISTTLQQRIQYQRYGGGGYAYLSTFFKQRLLEHHDISDAQFQQLTVGNPLRLLSWYTPPAAPEVPKEYLKCSVCKQEFEPIVGEYFTKFAYTYCGTKCLRRHSRRGFAPLDP